MTRTWPVFDAARFSSSFEAAALRLCFVGRAESIEACVGYTPSHRKPDSVMPSCHHYAVVAVCCTPIAGCLAFLLERHWHELSCLSAIHALPIAPSTCSRFRLAFGLLRFRRTVASLVRGHKNKAHDENRAFCSLHYITLHYTCIVYAAAGSIRVSSQLSILFGVWVMLCQEHERKSVVVARRAFTNDHLARSARMLASLLVGRDRGFAESMSPLPRPFRATFSYAAV